jgi:hypothetical protein
MPFAMENGNTHKLKAAQITIITMVALEVHAKKLVSVPLIHSSLLKMFAGHATKFVAANAADWNGKLEELLSPERGTGECADGKSYTPKQIWDRWKTLICPDTKLWMRAWKHVFPNGIPSGTTTLNDPDHWDPMRDFVWKECKGHAVVTAAKKRLAAALKRDKDATLEEMVIPARPAGWTHLCEGVFRRWGAPSTEYKDGHILFKEDLPPGKKKLETQSSTVGIEVARGKGAVGRDAQRKNELAGNNKWVDPKRAMLNMQMASLRQSKRDTALLSYVAETEKREKKLARMATDIQIESDEDERQILKSARKKLREMPSPVAPVFSPSPEPVTSPLASLELTEIESLTPIIIPEFEDDDDLATTETDACLDDTPI